MQNGISAVAGERAPKVTNERKGKDERDRRVRGERQDCAESWQSLVCQASPPRGESGVANRLSRSFCCHRRRIFKRIEPARPTAT